MSVEQAVFLDKPMRASGSTQPRLCPWPRLHPAVWRWAILEWQILDPGKRGFCALLLGFFLRSVTLYVISPPLPVLWPPECGPHGGARVVTRGWRCSWLRVCHLGLNRCSGLYEQGVLMFKGSSSIKMTWKLQPHRGWLTFPSFRISIYFHFQGNQFRNHRAFDYGIWWHVSDPGKPSCYRLSIFVFPKFICWSPRAQYGGTRTWGLWEVVLDKVMRVSSWWDWGPCKERSESLLSLSQSVENTLTENLAGHLDLELPNL